MTPQKIVRLSEQNIHIDKHPTSGNLLNTGQSLVFKVDTDRAANIPVNITGGPLSYRSGFFQLLVGVFAKTFSFFLCGSVILFSICSVV
jgi:hypothetical protein